MRTFSPFRSAFLILLTPLFGFAAPLLSEPKENESIAIIGNGLAERMIDHPYFETELHLRFPEKKLIIRNMARSGDTASFRPHPSRKTQWAFPGAEKFRPEFNRHAGEGHHPMPDEWLTTLKADTILAFFGYNESFDGEKGLEAFKGEIEAFIQHTLSQKYNGQAAPKLVLVSPIAYEDLSFKKNLPNGTLENKNLKLYTEALQEVASKNKIPFVDLFTPTLELYQTQKSFTQNGFIPTDESYKKISNLINEALFGATTINSKNAAAIHSAVLDKNWFWFNDYRMLNGVHVDGRRFKPFGNVNYPEEITKIRQITEIRDQAIWAATKGQKLDLAKLDQEKTLNLSPIETNYKPNEPDPQYLSGEEAISKMKLPKGYKAELFASEEKFPNLANPVQIVFDNRGRLWVATMPSYPHYKPGDGRPNDKILIYEDTDGDGKADKEIVFADNLHLPTGLELFPGGAYVAQEPHLEIMLDTDGDDRVDHREILLTGFDTHDTHHAISAFAADLSGAFMMCEGVFLHTNVETPYGPVRAMNGGFYRFDPVKTKLERTAQVSIPNPWGYTFDQWNQDFFLHTSGTDFNWLTPSTLKTPYGATNPLTKSLAPEGHKVRPTSGIEFMSSRHFPDEVQGDIMLCNTIGFLGIKQHSIEEDGTGYKTAHRQDLIQSSDPHFRPSDLEIAPDGSLYVMDWHNALIGHMQHSARDPRRDHQRGRIYRITYEGRPLLKPAKIHGASIPELLENLKLPEYRTRYRTRSELRSRPKNEVIPAVVKWVSTLDTKDPQYEHHLIEALGVMWGHQVINKDLLLRVLRSPDHRARAVAVRAIRYNTDLIPEYADLLKSAASDSHGRVRVEAIAASTWMDPALTREVVAIAKSMPVDEWIKGALDNADSRSKGAAELEVKENVAPPAPSHLADQEKAQFLKGHEIFFRDGHCATCHQKDGKGLEAAGFPPLTQNPWVSGSKERLIKLTLKGLLGPIEVNGVKYPGQVPMTPFGGLLNDEEIASVLTFVRNSFGNKASAITPQEVKAIREATQSSNQFYTPADLLKEHPLE